MPRLKDEIKGCHIAILPIQVQVLQTVTHLRLKTQDLDFVYNRHKSIKLTSARPCIEWTSGVNPRSCVYVMDTSSVNTFSRLATANITAGRII
jgi:hypothetical protein